MPTFRYQAVDSRGQTSTGTVQAQDAREVQRLLSQRGLMVQQVVRVPDSTAATAPAQPATMPEWESSEVSPHTMGFLMVQLQALLKAGYSAAEAFRLVSGRVNHKPLNQACAEIAEKAAQGVPISQAMLAYPRLFPAFVVGAIQAGETGGYLPDAIGQLVEYYENWRSFRMWGVPAKGCFLITVLSLPIVAPFGLGLIYALRQFTGSEVGNPAAGLGVVFQGWWQAFLQIGLPLLVGLIVAWGVWGLINRMEWFRARFQLRAPLVWGYADWVRAQSLQMFLYHLSRLSAVGLAPASVWELAVRTVPNAAIASSLAAVNLARGERAEPLDSALARSGMFPPEEVALVTTGIQSGQVVEMLQRLADYYHQRSQDSFRQTRMGLLRMAVLIGLLGTGIALILMYWGWYGHMIQFVEDWLGTP
jgi:type II secretory pathway component PulF